MFSPLKSNQLPFLARCALSTTVLILAVIFLLVINGNADQMNRQSATFTLGNFELEENLPSSKAFDFQTKLHETSTQIRNEDWIKKF